MQAAVNPRLRITELGTSAASPIRGSITPNAANAASATAIIPSTRESPQPQSADWSSASSSITRPSERVRMPA